MRRFILLVIALGFCMSPASYAYAQQSAEPSAQKSPLTQKMGEKEVTFAAIDRLPFAYSDGLVTIRPKAGQEIVLIRLVVKFTQKENGMSVDASDIELQDVNGNKYTYFSSVFAESSDSTKPYWPEFPFSVPKGTLFKKFRLKDISFEIESLDRSGTNLTDKQSTDDPISGEWDVTLLIQEKTFTGETLKLKLHVGNVTGELSSDKDIWKISKGTWASDQLYLTFNTPEGEAILIAAIKDGTLTGDMLLNKILPIRLKAKKRV